MDKPVVLDARNLRVRYANGALGTHDVSFRVSAGQVVAIFGPNGAGKSSSVRAVSGFLRTEGAKVTRGSVHLFGQDVTNDEPHRQARLGLAFVPERNKVFPNLTVTENLIALGRLPERSRRQELEKLVFTLFPKLADCRKQPAGRLSGGQRQMLALGRALMVDPKLLVVDEMTLGLHHSLQPTLFEAVRAVAATGTAVVVVDEATGFALQVADYCYVLSAGTVHEEGPSDKFREGDLIAAGYVGDL